MTMAMSPAALAAILLTDRNLPSDAPPLTALEFWPLVRSVDFEELAAGHGGVHGAAGEARSVEPERIDALLARGTSMAFELDRLRQSGISVISALDDDYPGRLRDRLGDGAPPLLYAAGDVSLFSRKSLAIVGSRDVDEAGADVARRAARAAAERGMSVVSGGARGVDQLAMSAAWDADGAVLGVLSEGLERALRSGENRAAVLEGRALLCSPYKPTAGFSTGNAMGRNKIVYALSDVALVVASDEGSGGTWAGATEALKKHLAPIVAWMGDGAGTGNAALVTRGATPVSDVTELFTIDVDGVGASTREVAAQAATQLGFDLPA
jgi:predicted Rossmann fold nucleotide-binding protein DprA/Smf involved in DNA uptake